MATDTLVTVEQWAELEESDVKTELVKGEAVEVSWATDRHNWTRQRIWRLIDEYLDTRHIGRAWVEQAFRITPDTARIPDAAFATFERYDPSYLDRNVMPFVPNLAVEVVSATDRAEGLRDKVCDYLDNGADTVWVVYLNRRQAEIWDRGAGVRVVTDTLRASCLPELEIPLSAVIEGVGGSC